MEKLLIVGAGDGGIILSHFLPKNRFDITFIDPEEMHYFQPLQLHIAFRGTGEKSIRKTKLLPRNSKLIKARAESVDLANRTVVTDSGTYTYDRIVIDTGSTGDYSKIPGHKQLYEEFGDFHSNTAAAKRMYSKVSSFAGGNAVIGVTYPTYKCPPSPVEAAFLFEQYVNNKHLKNSTEMTFITPFPRAYPSAPMNEIVEPMLKERGVNIIPFFDVDSIDTKTRTITSIEGDKANYDFAALVPPHKGAGIVKDLSDDEGFVTTDKYTLNIGKYDDAFCIGDATNIPTAKSAVTAHLEARTVSQRMMGNDAKFNGRTNCPLETGYGKGAFVISSYEDPAVKMKPSRYNYMMKMMMAAMAWPALKGNMEWLFNIYFDMHDPKKLNEKAAKRANK